VENHIKIPWKGDRCIICLEASPLTREHLIPEVLSGKLEARFLCKPCNDRLGSEIDHSACSDPLIRQAAFELPDVPRERHTKINRKLNQGQKFVIITSHGEIEAIAKGDLIQPVTFKSEDGYLVQPSEAAIRDIKKTLAQRGQDAQSIADAVSKHAAAPVDQAVEIAPRIVIRKRSFDASTIHPKGKSVNSLLLLKIAYEFLALCLGNAIYGEQPELDQIRHTLRTLDRKNAFVEFFERENNYHVHGIAFEGNDPFARVQVRLFGSLAFRVNFPRIAVGGPCFAYTHDLSDGKESVVEYGGAPKL
jgi:hypothetical protein